MKKYTAFIIAILWLLAACGSKPERQTGSLAEKRKAFTTKVLRHTKASGEVPVPPDSLFKIVQYTTALGNMPAYLGSIPQDGRKHAAMIWIGGGFGNDIGDVWSPQDEKNDQSAAAFREAGIVMMFPAQRGGNTSAGSDESCFGEIEDIIAAARFLAAQPGVDPDRIYLGGHSTGGTKAILAAESSRLFRAVFAFGPVAAITDYEPHYLTFDLNNKEEILLRSPVSWLSSISCPLFVFEGAAGGNTAPLDLLAEEAKAQDITGAHFYLVQGKDHFSILAPVTKVIAGKILEDTGQECKIAIRQDELL